MQLRGNLPRVLNELFIHLAAPRGVGFGTDLNVGVGQSECEVGQPDARSGSISSSRIGKGKGAVLVAGSAWNGGDVDLVVIILAGVLEEKPTFNGVVSPYLGETV